MPLQGPNHHADPAFELAVRRAPHWRLGDMPAQAAVTPAEVAQITRYVRKLQQARSIDARCKRGIEGRGGSPE